MINRLIKMIYQKLVQVIIDMTNLYDINILMIIKHNGLPNFIISDKD